MSDPISIAKQMVKAHGLKWLKPHESEISLILWQALLVMKKLDLSEYKEIHNTHRAAWKKLLIPMRSYFEQVRKSRKKPRKERKSP